MFRKVITWVSGPILAAFFLWLCFRGVSLSELGQQLTEAKVGLLLASVATVFLHLLLRAWRWRTLLAPVKKGIPFLELLSATSIGYMASLLPGRVGEVLRPALVSRRADVPFAPALASVAVERVLLDLLAILFAGALALILPTSISGLGAGADPVLLASLHTFGGLILVGGLAALAATSLMARHRVVIGAWLVGKSEGMKSRPLAALVAWIAKLFPGLGAFASVRGLLRLAFETALIWSVIGIGIYWGIIACGITLAPGAWLIMLPILAAGIGIPTPGGTGTYHFAMKLGLVKLFAAGEAAALGAGVVVHAVTWLPVLIMGGLFIARGGLVRLGVPAGEVVTRVAPSAGEVTP